MANKSKNTSIIIGICAAVVVVALVVVAIVLSTREGGVAGLNDSFFTSDESKLVVEMDTKSIFTDEDEHVPEEVNLVYFYSGDSITGLKAYYKYADEAAAKAARDYLAERLKDEYKTISQDGIYVILEANEDEYKSTTVDDVKQQIEFIEMLKSLDVDDEESEEEPNIQNVEPVEEEDEEGMDVEDENNESIKE